MLSKMKLLLAFFVAFLNLLPNANTATYYVKGDNHCNNCCRGLPGPQGVPGLPGLHGARGRMVQLGSRERRETQGLLGKPDCQGFQEKMDTKVTGVAKGRKENVVHQDQPDLKATLDPLVRLVTKVKKGHKGEKGAHPPRIAFTVSRSEPLGPVMQKTPVTFDKIHTNLGNSFDVYSSHFICKINGTYFFTVHVLSAENRTAYGWIMLNNDHQMAFHGDAQAFHGTGSNTVILHLVRDDHVWVQLNENSSLLNHFSSFSGHILFED